MTIDTSLQRNELPAIEQALLQAVVQHQSGDLHEAEKLYESILRIDPKHPKANHNMGALLLQRKQATESLACFLNALEAEPACAQYWLSYIDAMHQAGQTEEAKQLLDLARQQGLQGGEVDALATRLEGGSLVAELSVTGEHQPAKSPGDASDLSPQDIDTLVSLFTTGRLNEALSLARKLTHRFPQNGVCWKALGTAYMQMGKCADALLPMQKAAALSPDDAEAHNNLGIALYESGRLEEAEASYRQALLINPDYASAHSNLGAILQKVGRLIEAEASYRQALQIDPVYAKALNNLGSILQESGQLDEVETCFRRALQIQPFNAESHLNLCLALKALGRLSEAEASCRRALEIRPDYPDAHYQLGNVCYDLNRMEEAENCYRRALQIDPGFAGALNHLALLFNTQGNSQMALKAIRQSLRIEETVIAKNIFVACVKRSRFTHDDREIRSILVRALTEPWGRPGELAQTCIGLIKLDPEVRGCLARVNEAWPRHLGMHELYGSHGLAVLANDNLFHALLETEPVCDIELERFLTMARHVMLDDAYAKTCDSNEEGLGLYSAIAQQNFINEYVCSCTDDEIAKANRLRDTLAAALESDAPIFPLWLMAVAAYFSLYALPFLSRLFEPSWPKSVTALLVQQVREPEEEMRLRSSIPRLTDIEDEISLLVQNQYEENPYPRWVRLGSGVEAMSIMAYLRQKFPLAVIGRHEINGSTDLLVAGCGTGQHSIASALRTRGAEVLAIDLSLNSLSYAKRKTCELGLSSIEYAQADILKLGKLERSFDVIESSGVLHHLADPWAGWQVLVALLRNGGFMKIGLYSETARRDIVRVRNLIAENGYGSTAREIRRCRQDLMNTDTDFGAVLSSPDFFSTSACRDLLFHVQEHRMTLDGICAFLKRNKLNFLGFEIDTEVIRSYRERFPGDQGATDLEQWQVFENENPDIFANMYQFWAQKGD